MSRTFIGFGQAQYIGIPQTLPIKISGLAGVIIPLFFQWLSYGASTQKPSINVLVDMETSPCKRLDQIRSVYIDNLGSDNPIYIYFPDTSCTLAAKANSEGWYPAYTNQKKMWVIGEGFLTGDIPQTFISVSNIPFTASVNTEIDNAVALWRASPVITRGSSIYNSSLGIPALGDQFQSSQQLDMTVVGSSVPLWSSPYTSGFLFITAIQLNITDVSVPAGPEVYQIVVESTGISGTLFSPIGSATNTIQSGIQPLLQLSGLQIKLDATQTWRMRNTNGLLTGLAQLISSFTQQP